MQERFIRVPDGNVWCGIAGEDNSGIPLLALHGGPGANSEYLEPLEALADSRSVIFYDQLGCGKSKALNNKDWWTVDHFVEELNEVVSCLNLKEFHLLGQSWGAFLAVAYWLSYRPAPVKSLILSGPCLSAPHWIADQQRYLDEMSEAQQDIIRQTEKDGDYENQEYQAAVGAYCARHVCRLNPWPDLFVRMFQGINAEMYNYMWGPSEFTVNGTLREKNLIPQLPEVSVPVLLTCGEFDEAHPDTVRKYAETFPDARIHVLKDASHCHHLEKPEEFLSVIQKFMMKMD